MSAQQERTTYLVQEAVLFLLFSYLILLGGTFNGLVIFRIYIISAGLLAAGGMVWLAYRWRHRGRSVGTVLDAPVAVFTASVLISSVFSSDPRRSLIRLGGFLFAVLVYYLVVEVIRGGVPTNLMVKTLLLVSGFVIFFGFRELWIWYRGWLEISSPGEIVPPATYRVRAFIGHPNFTAAYLNLLIPLALSRLVGAKRVQSRIVLGGWAAAALFLVFFTSSRGGWLGTFAAVGTFSFLAGLANPGILQSFWGKLKDNKGAALVAGAGLVGIGYLVVRALAWQVSHPSHPSDLGNITASRDYIWGVAWRMFRDNPWVGKGPFTYATEYIREISVPPGILLAHAHNFYLNVLAEHGLVGFLSLSGLIMGVLYLCWQAWRRHQFLSRVELAGLYGSLAGLGVHSLVETPQTLPVLLVLPTLLTGMIAAGVPVPGSASGLRIRNILVTGMVGIGLCMLGWNTVSFLPYQRAVEQAAAGNWAESEQLLKKAIKRDPRNALHWFELGYTQGILSLAPEPVPNAQEKITEAIQSYQAALDLEPNYSVNHLNTGLLLWNAGRIEEAKKELETAVHQAPDQAGFQLTLGSFLEQEGFHEEALIAYREALIRKPHWAQSGFFRETQLREEVMRTWTAGKPTHPVAYDPELEWGWVQMQQDNYSGAAAFFHEKLDTNYAEAYFSLGVAQLGLGEEAAAVRKLQTVIWMGSKNEWLLVRANFLLGDIFRDQGNCRVAERYYRDGLALLENANAYGLGKQGIEEYAWYAFYRPSPPGDTLPGYVVVRFTDQTLIALSEYTDCLENMGSGEEANRVSGIISRVERGLIY